MKYLKYILILPCLFSMASCSLFGLDYTEDHDYESRVRPNDIHMNVWDFIHSREDIFSTLIEGIEYAGLTEADYNAPGNTYFLLTNNALSDWESNGNCYWSRNKIKTVYEGQEMMMRAVAWNQYPKEQVKEMLLYHTLKGEWSYHNISTDTKWYETMGNGKYTYTDNNGNTVEGDTAKISMVVRMVREAPIQLNNWSWNYRGVLSETTGSIRSSNLKATNGYIHVLDYYLERPTRAFLEEN